ncbi:unnamed protein product [Hermetia illucens]|uniref:Chitin-binding type-2 domain-containing protein n=1 Tax=Hermetia illucens TaxID=343691 RepID=A0A7R8UGZ1_HERIL|nr:protein obstructor-E-like [Hermetia illucens]CAD7080690.1 unnamed protein product [Hermetia illucens]
MYLKVIQGTILILLSAIICCNGDDILGCGAMPHGSVLPHTECYKFFYCYNGVVVILDCPEYFKFIQEDGKCEYDPSCLHGDSSSVSSEDACKGVTGEKNVESGISCKYYYNCINGIGVLKSCPDGWGFNKDDQMCVKEFQCVKT